MKKQQTFSGGYRFKELVGSPKPEVMKTGIPDEVVIPLRQGSGEEVPPTVKAGDKVKAGQIIGIDDASCSSPVHATVNGTVKDVCKIKRFGQEIGAVVIKSDGSSGWSKMDTGSNEISRTLYLSGVASLCRVGFPTRFNTSLIQPDDVDRLVINAINSEPFAMSNQILLMGDVDRFIDGVDILKRALPGSVEVYVGIDHRDKGIIKQIETAADWLHVHPLKPKYPQDNDVILVRTILGRKIPYGGSVADVNAVVMDVQSVLHAYEAVVEGKPVIE